MAASSQMARAPTLVAGLDRGTGLIPGFHLADGGLSHYSELLMLTLAAVVAMPHFEIEVLAGEAGTPGAGDLLPHFGVPRCGPLARWR